MPSPKNEEELKRQEAGYENYKDPFNRKPNHLLAALFDGLKKSQGTPQQDEEIKKKIVEYYNAITEDPSKPMGYTEDQMKWFDKNMDLAGLPKIDHLELQKEYNGQYEKEVSARVKKQLAEEGYTTAPYREDYRYHEYSRRLDALKEAYEGKLKKTRKRQYQGAGELEE